jgi:Fanconi anemia group M protein
VNIPAHGVYADDRERASGIPEMLRERFRLSVVESRLPVGDYWLGSGIIVERKTLDDFALSIIDGRLFRQIQRMKQRAETAVLILEGNPAKSLSVDLNPHAFKGGLLSVALDWETPVLFSKSAEDTALLLWLMQEKHGPLKKSISIRPGRRPKRLNGRQLYVLQGLPSIGPTVAGRLLEHFGTVERVINASVDQLIEVAGVGNKTADKIREVVSAPAVPQNRI